MPSFLAAGHRCCAPWRTVTTTFNTRLLPTASSGRVRHSMAGQLNAASSAQGVPMIERISLLSFPEEFREDAGPAAVDNIWSLQYMAPGALCGAAGPLIQLPTGSTQQQQSAEQQTSPFTHAVMLRFANSRNLEGFQAHPRTQSVTAAVLDGGCTGMSVLTVATQLPNELESLFRRGGDFDIGFELIAVLRLAEGASKSDAEDVLRQLQQLAESSVFGAVQASQGPCTQLQQLYGPAGEEQPAVGAASLELQQQPDYVFLARFQTQEQLTGFLRCPPVEALLQWDERLPLRAEWAGAMEVAPTEKSQSTSQGKGRLL